MTTTVADVGGCRGGWLCVLREAKAPFRERALVVKSVQDVFLRPDAPAAIAIDIPAGLPGRISGAGRDCDTAARAVLGKRTATVFSVPARAALAGSDYRSGCAAALAHSDPPRQISLQMFHLFPKVREADDAMTPALQERICECHTEAAFWAMNNRVPLCEPKKVRGRRHLPGLEQRRALLLAHGFSAALAGPGDFLDACACAWSAARFLKGDALRFPESPPLDPKGLRMEILA
jgi:predicted RNase H-like nuclease